MTILQSRMSGHPYREPAPATVNELCDRYERWAEKYYQRTTESGKRVPTGEHLNMRDALRAIRAVAGDRSPDSLTAEDLCAAQEWLLKQRKPNGAPLTRNVINNRILRIRRMVKWATKPPHRWIPLHVLTDLSLVESLKPERSEARDTAEVKPVAWDDIKIMLEALAEEGLNPRRSEWALTLALMIEIHWLTGMRPGELVSMKEHELSIEHAALNLWEGETKIMVYRPFMHKTKHYGLERHIFIGPEARRLIEDQLRRIKSSDGRLWPYTTNSYRTAVARFQAKRNLPRWTPNQMRHAFATRMRDLAGIDVAQVLLGHRHRSTTEIYAKPNTADAIAAIMRYA